MNRRLVSKVKLVRRLLALTVGLGTAAGLLILVQALLLTHIVNGVFLGKWRFSQVVPLLWMLLGAIALRALFGWLSEVSALRAAVRVKEQLRMDLVRHLFQLGPAFLQREQSGELVNTAFEGVEQLEPYLARYLPQVSLSALIPVAILALTFSHDILSGLIMLVTAPIIVVFMVLIGKTAQGVADKQWRAMSILSAHFFDVLRGISTLKLFNRSQFQISVIQRMSEDYRKTTMGTLRVAFLSSFVLELMATLGTAMIAVAIGLRLISGHMTFADGFVVLLLAPEFYAPIRALGTQYHASINGVSAADRILDILSTQPLGLQENPHGRRPNLDTNVATGGQTAVARGAVSGALQNADCSADNNSTDAATNGAGRETLFAGHSLIEYVDVDFSYEAGREGVRRLNFAIRPGEKVAIVGETGSGKSTIINLLLGFVRQDRGVIKVNGANLEDLDTTWWREQVAYVPQTSHLFQGTIADNLRIARKDASPQELRRACQMASADDFIEQLPRGYETVIGEQGKGLSGGQVQRLALARAFLKDSPILVLDEPTAHLDIGNESAVEDALTHLLASRTALIVAHRLSTIYRADRILVLHNGRISGQGRHEELLKTNLHYQGLLQSYQGHKLHGQELHGQELHGPEVLGQELQKRRGER